MTFADLIVRKGRAHYLTRHLIVYLMDFESGEKMKWTSTENRSREEAFDEILDAFEDLPVYCEEYCKDSITITFNIPSDLFNILQSLAATVDDLINANKGGENVC